MTKAQGRPGSHGGWVLSEPTRAQDPQAGGQWAAQEPAKGTGGTWNSLGVRYTWDS